MAMEQNNTKQECKAFHIYSTLSGTPGFPPPPPHVTNPYVNPSLSVGADVYEDPFTSGGAYAHGIPSTSVGAYAFGIPSTSGGAYAYGIPSSNGGAYAYGIPSNGGAYAYPSGPYNMHQPVNEAQGGGVSDWKKVRKVVKALAMKLACGLLVNPFIGTAGGLDIPDII